MAKAATSYALGPSRVQFQNKDPRGWQEFADQLAQHSSTGAALTMRGVQKRRPSLYDLVDEMTLLTVPVILGQGARLFPETGPDLALDLVESRVDSKGVTIQVYRPAGRPRYAGA